jgi:hypothetical protein
MLNVVKLLWRVIMSKEQSSEIPPNTPVMTYDQYQQGAQMMQQFLKGIDIKVKGKRVETIYKWEFPDELVAKTFAENMKEQFEGAMEPKK